MNMKQTYRTNWTGFSAATIATTIATLGAIASGPVHASGFLLAPTRLFFEGSARSQELTIMNQSDKTQTYRLRVEDRRLKENGTHEVITDPSDPIAASSMLRLSVRQVVIPAQSSASIRVLLRKPSGQASGEVRSHLIVSELPVVGAPEAVGDEASGITVAISTIFSISIPILVRTGDTAARVVGASVQRATNTERPELETLTVRLETSGNRSLFADIRLVSTRQRRAEPIAQIKSAPVYAPAGARTFTMSLDPEQTAKLRAGNVVLQYQVVRPDGSPVGASSEIAF